MSPLCSAHRKSTACAISAGAAQRATGERELSGGGSSSTGEVGKIVVVMDFRGFSVFNQPPMKTSLATLSILQVREALLCLSSH